MRRVILGETGSGKTENAIKRYCRMLSDGISSNDILVLVANRTERIKWMKNVDFKVASQLRIFSYFGFIQRELKLFWPLVLKECRLIKKHEIEPVFMHYEASQSLMSKTVEFYRKKDYLKGIISSDEEIARKLLSNITGASLSNTSYKKIGERIFRSKTEEEQLGVEFYKEMNEITVRYIERILEEGIVDNAVSIYLYFNYLLKDEKYLEYLQENIKYLVVDNLENGSISQADFIMELSKWVKGSILYYNTDGSYGIYQFSRNYMEKELLPNFQEERLGKNENSEKFREFTDTLSKNLMLDTGERAENSDIKTDLENEFRSKEDKKVLRLVAELLEKGVPGNEISVITPRYNVTLDFGLSRISEKNKIKYLYTSKNDKVTDNPYVFALAVFAVVFYRFEKIRINYDEMKVFINIILQMDLISSALLADYLSKRDYRLESIEDKQLMRRLPLVKIEEYNSMVEFIKSMDRDTPINQFFTSVYLEYFVGRSDDAKDIKACRELMDSSEDFIRVMESFQMLKDANYEFIKFIREGAKTTPTLEDIGVKLEGGYMSLSTPGSFIGTGRKSEILILTDVRNPLYTLKSYNEFQNLWSLNKDWPLGRVFTGEDELQMEKLDLDAVIKRLFRSVTGEIYLFGTVYSGRGMEQHSLLYDALLRTLG
ncbi:UvrD-helicase domain-containing protein [uncultured Ilyobacter sp.]|uniref:UvrD-helicase domain-containing protein n=1 Tax=uncultured Ilyobacter sp. TaxID=544433 RepID=UPI0029C68ECC|nr:UvrD-helicase domain-containing protein [uncultured Ilyobacter sp.]